MINSRIYAGRVRHNRFSPKRHGFDYSLFLMYLDLDELPDLFSSSWLWSSEKPAIARFHREDHLGDPSVSLKESVKQVVFQQTGERFEGNIRLLTHLRYFGHVFNPVSFYYCFTTQGQLQFIVAEVNNTPWNQQYCYVVKTGSTHEGQSGMRVNNINKKFHVSPFMPMDMTYRWYLSEPKDDLTVVMQSYREGSRVFSAAMNLQEQPLNQANLIKVLIRYPLMTIKVVSAIYFEALRLWLKGIPFHNHPGQTDRRTETSQA